MADPIKEKVETAMDVHRKIEAILKEYDGKESDVPLDHIYWNLLNKYRRLRSLENA